MFDLNVVRRRLQNERDSDSSYLQATVRFRDGTYVRGSNIDNVTDLPAGSAWEYSVTYTPAPIESGGEISAYDVFAST